MQINIDTHADAHLLEVTAAFLFTISNAALRASVTGGATPPAADVAAPVDETPTPAPSAATAEAPARRARRSKAEIEAETAKVQEPATPEAPAVVTTATVAEAPTLTATVADSTPAPTYTKETVQQKLGELLSTKGMPACKALLESYNVAGIGALKPEQYAEFIGDISKAMGAA